MFSVTLNRSIVRSFIHSFSGQHFTCIHQIRPNAIRFCVRYYSNEFISVLLCKQWHAQYTQTHTSIYTCVSNWFEWWKETLKMLQLIGQYQANFKINYAHEWQFKRSLSWNFSFEIITCCMIPKWLQFLRYKWFSWFNQQLIDFCWNWCFG